LFPKGRSGIVRQQWVGHLLRSPVYAGYVEAPNWDVSLRKGHHEALISFETFQRIQDRLNGATYAPRKDHSEDFPLRGYVNFHCGTPLTACWSKGRISKHPYYLCPNKRGGCPDYGKSIRRDVMHAEFEKLLRSVTPNETLFGIATRMFEELWRRRLERGEEQVKALAEQLTKVDRQVAQLLERVLDASVPSVIGAYEQRIAQLEKEKIVIREKVETVGRPKGNHDRALRTALSFLSSPWNLWTSERP
jgi:hypothetical protein